MSNQADISIPVGEVDSTDKKGTFSWKGMFIGLISGLIGNIVSFIVPLGLEVEKRSYLIGAALGSLLQIVIIVVLVLVL